MRRRTRRKIRKMLVKVSVYIAGLICMLSVIALDSELWVLPLVAMIISGAYVFGYVELHKEEYR